MWRVDRVETNSRKKRKIMAIQFDLNALSRFSNVNFGDNDAIANLDGGNGLVGSS